MTHTRYTDPQRLRRRDRVDRRRPGADRRPGDAPAGVREHRRHTERDAAGRRHVHNTNTLLGHDGFVGVKTGSDTAAGGCFAFRAIRWIDGRRTTITGVVLGQPGPDRIDAGLAAADAMVDRIAVILGAKDELRRSTAANPAPGSSPRFAGP